MLVPFFLLAIPLRQSHIVECSDECSGYELRLTYPYLYRCDGASYMPYKCFLPGTLTMIAAGEEAAHGLFFYRCTDNGRLKLDKVACALDGNRIAPGEIIPIKGPIATRCASNKNGTLSYEVVGCKDDDGNPVAFESAFRYEGLDYNCTRAFNGFLWFQRIYSSE